MPLSNKLKADYTELINQGLDTIRIDSIEDFDLVQQALHHIIQPAAASGSQQIQYQIPEKYKEKIFVINDYLKDPGDYVQNESDYDEYKQIITSRIAAKINEFQSLSASQKQDYIQHQENQRSQIATHQQIMFQHQPPPLMSQDEELIHTAIQLIGGTLTVADFAGMDLEQLYYVTQLACIQAIQDGVFTIPELIDVDDSQLPYVTQPACIQAIQDGRTSIEQLKTMSANELRDAVSTDDFSHGHALSF